MKEENPHRVLRAMKRRDRKTERIYRRMKPGVPYHLNVTVRAYVRRYETDYSAQDAAFAAAWRVAKAAIVCDAPSPGRFTRHWFRRVYAVRVNVPGNRETFRELADMRMLLSLGRQAEDRGRIRTRTPR